MNDFFKFFKFTTLAVLIVLATHFASAAWNEPTATPPGANTPEPINVSGTAQIKTGGVTLSALGGTGNQTIIGRAADAVSAYFRAVVYGNIGADKYCDRNGANCYTSTEMFTNGGGGGGLDEKVKGSSTDTTAGYLSDKIQNSITVITNKLQLIGDILTPGNNKCYGSNAAGVKGWYTCDVDTKAGGGVTKIIAGTGIAVSPTNGVGDVTVSKSGGTGDHYVIQLVPSSNSQVVNCNAGDVAVGYGMVGHDGDWGVEFTNYADLTNKRNPNGAKLSDLSGQTIQMLCLDK